MAELYPTNMPIPLINNYSQKSDPHVKIQSVEIGPPRFEFRSDFGHVTFSVKWLFDDLEFQVFEGWFRHVLEQGNLSFNMNLMIGGGLKNHECFFDKGYKTSLKGKKWSISAKLKAVVKLYDDLSTYLAARLLLENGPSTVDPRLVAYWEFEEDADPTEDLTGLGHTLVEAFGNPIAYSVGANGTGKSLFVNPAVALRTFYAPASSDWDFTNDFTIIFSAKVTSDSGSLIQFILRSASSVFDAYFSIGYYSNRNQFVFETTTGSNDLDSSSSTPNFNTWYRVAFTFNDSTKDLYCYVDGVLANYISSPSTSPVYEPTARLCIGSAFNSNGNKFRGELDAVKIYHVALSSADVLDEFNNY